MGFEEIYRELVTVEKQHEDELYCLCPLHDDANQSFHVDSVKGLWHCKVCGVGGNTKQLLEKMYEVESQVADYELKILEGEINTFKYVSNISSLAKSNAVKDYLNKREISDATKIKFDLSANGNRLIIPIKSLSGKILGVKRHLTIPITDDAMVKTLNETGSKATLFPLEALKENKVLILEGEPDVIKAHDLGLNAITMTCGASSFNADMAALFKGKEVEICLDTDEAGIKNATSIFRLLETVASKVKLIWLPTEGLPKKADFTDFILLKGVEEFNNLHRSDLIVADGLNEIEIHLSETINPTLYNQKIKTTAIVTGKGSLYMVPKKFNVSCSGGNDDHCDYCKLKATKFGTFTLPPHSRLLLELARSNDEDMKFCIKRSIKVPRKCMKLKLEILETYNLEEVMLIPEIDYTNNKSSYYISRQAFVVGSRQIEANKPYIIKALVTTHPMSQISVLLIYNTIPTKDNIDDFKMTPELYEKLKVFQANSLEEMREVQNKKFDDYEIVSKIYNRRSLLFATELVFCSVIDFVFMNKRLKRSHLIALIYGDTRSGKSDTVDSLIEHFKAGDKISGENASFAGIVGGVHKSIDGSKWGITWKKIPLNNRRLVRIDEFHQMHPDEICKLSELMSTGIASIDKIHTEQTMAKTRLIFIANCRNGEDLNTHRFGCQAALSIMGNHNEDVARLDFALAVSNKDVSQEIIRKRQSEELEVQTYTSDICHELIMWGWSRASEDIVFEQAAVKKILEEADNFSKKYNSSVPLVTPAEQHIKLARLAVACAVSFFSTDSTGQQVIVKEEHVILTVEFLHTIFSDKSMLYNKYSEFKFSKDCIKDLDDLKRLGLTTYSRDMLLNLNTFNNTGVEHTFNVSKDDARDKIYLMLRNNCIIPYGTNMFKKTPAFIKYLTENEFGEVAEHNIF